jgi:hypothetical protein
MNLFNLINIYGHTKSLVRFKRKFVVVMLFRSHSHHIVIKNKNVWSLTSGMITRITGKGMKEAVYVCFHVLTVKIGKFNHELH